MERLVPTHQIPSVNSRLLASRCDAILRVPSTSAADCLTLVLLKRRRPCHGLPVSKLLEMQGVHGSDRADVDVLVVDDDVAIRSTSAHILRDAGYSVAMAEDGDVALRHLEKGPVGMVLLDLRMPRRDGLSVLEAITAPQLVVLVSAYSLDEATRARVDAKVVTYLEKPVPPNRLLDTVATTLRRPPVTDWRLNQVKT
jgi:CheY-like chemotaxis protein